MCKETSPVRLIFGAALRDASKISPRMRSCRKLSLALCAHLP